MANVVNLEVVDRARSQASRLHEKRLRERQSAELAATLKHRAARLTRLRSAWFSMGIAMMSAGAISGYSLGLWRGQQSAVASASAAAIHRPSAKTSTELPAPGTTRPATPTEADQPVSGAMSVPAQDAAGPAPVEPASSVPAPQIAAPGDHANAPPIQPIGTPTAAQQAMTSAPPAVPAFPAPVEPKPIHVAKRQPGGDITGPAVTAPALEQVASRAGAKATRVPPARQAQPVFDLHQGDAAPHVEPMSGVYERPAQPVPAAAPAPVADARGRSPNAVSKPEYRVVGVPDDQIVLLEMDGTVKPVKVGSQLPDGQVLKKANAHTGAFEIQ